MEEGMLDLREIIEEMTSVNRRDYQYFDNLFNRRTIVFNQEVSDDLLEGVILPLRKFEEDDSQEPVSLIFNTVGGSILDGLVMLDIIDNYKKPLNIYVYGYAMSMGAIILAAGNKNPNVHKYCHSFSFGLLHSGDTNLSGNTTSCRQAMEFFAQVDERVKNYFIENTNFTEEKWRDIEGKEFYMTAEQMKDFGLIDEII